MALIKETILANEALKSLTEEQVSAIETLSTNDEDAVIGKRIGEIYREMDSTIEQATGVKRDGAEKTYNYLARATKQFAEKYSDYEAMKTSVQALNSENEKLKAEIAKGGDEALKGQIKSLNTELESTKDLYNALKTSYDEEKERHARTLLDYKIDSEISRAKEGLKFKGGLNENALEALVGKAVSAIKAKNPSFEERGGEQRLVFHDENGSPLNNRENKLNPYTAQELLIKELETLDILDNKPAKGAGGVGNPPTHSSIISATTQTEAEKVIAKSLADKGLVRGSAQFQAEFNKAWEENNISSLPLR